MVCRNNPAVTTINMEEKIMKTIAMLSAVAVMAVCGFGLSGAEACCKNADCDGKCQKKVEAKCDKKADVKCDKKADAKCDKKADVKCDKKAEVKADAPVEAK